MLTRLFLALGAVLAIATAAAAQGNPTGTISGHIADETGLAVPGVTVTAASPVLQGVRTAVSSGNGDYIIPFLPAGEYEVTFELSGFRTVTRQVSVTMAATQTIDVTLVVAALAETITVSGTVADIVPTATIAANFRSFRDLRG